MNARIDQRPVAEGFGTMANNGSSCGVHGYFCKRRGFVADPLRNNGTSVGASRPPSKQPAMRPTAYVAVGIVLAGALVSALQFTHLDRGTIAAIALLASTALAIVFGQLVGRSIARLTGPAKTDVQLGMYELESRIAQGGMGEVWRARHQLLSRPAAVKLIRTGLDGARPDSLALRRFEREAQVTASLKSTHTVQLYDFGVTESGTFYYVMELLDGIDLEQYVARSGPLESRRVVSILTQILDSIVEAHEHGLVHRDIKPANVNLSRRGLEEDFATVLDFGLVKGVIDADGSTVGRDLGMSLTAENRITGTPAYMAPEVIKGDAPIDGRADLYSLGCVAYFLLTGKLVFEAKTPMQMAIAHVSERPLPPSQRTRQAVPKGLESVILKCLEKNPERRYANAMTLLEVLRGLDFDEVSRPRASASTHALELSN